MKIKKSDERRGTSQRGAGQDTQYATAFPPATFNLQPATSPLDSPPRHPSLATRHSSGVALVITLILLSVITFMAVTFLVVTRSEHGSVTTETDQAMAKGAAEVALEQAKVQLLSTLLATGDPSAAGLLVSTNWRNDAGFINSGPAYTSFTNVNYDHYVNGNPVNSLNDRLQNLANLRYFARVPVFVTNRSAANSMDFRFYLDLNRNGRYDTNGLLPVISPDPAKPFYDLGGNTIPAVIPGNTLSNFFMGDPEWVGISDRPSYAPALYNSPNFPQGFGHSSSNRFVGRYAFLVVPASEALDINAIHDYAKGPAFGGLKVATNMNNGDGFLRNMGAATYEINLGAFLTDLNTNYWPPTNGATTYGQWYRYDPVNTNLPNTGAGFDDAAALLRYRYVNNWNHGVASVASLFGNSGQGVFAHDSVDGYSAGPVMTGFHWLPANRDGDNGALATFGWPGAENRNRYYDPQDLFDQTKTRFGVAPSALSVSDRLLAAGKANSSYDRYTFYRMLQQMGTDSGPERDKINVNSRNMTNGVIVPDLATNFYPWNAAEFFTNAVARLLTTTFSDPRNPYFLTNLVDKGHIHIRVYPTNCYTPAVHRILQVVANIYDASKTNDYGNPSVPDGLPTGLPTVFRPLFSDGPLTNEVFITGYAEVTNSRIAFTDEGYSQVPFLDLTFTTNRPLSKFKPIEPMVHGIPLVVGARKGFPSFNSLAMQTSLKVSRKLEFHRDVPNGPPTQTNQMYVLSISNTFGADVWNSYTNLYPRPTYIVGRAELMATVTNESGTNLLIPVPDLVFQTLNAASPPCLTSNFWPAYPGASQITKRSYSVLPMPVATNYVQFLTNSSWRTTLPYFTNLVGNGAGQFVQINTFPVPHWWLVLRTRLRFALVDRATDRIVDYVNLESWEPPFDIVDYLQREDPANTNYLCGGDSSGVYAPPQTTHESQMWCTNREIGGVNVTNDFIPTFGVLNQIMLGLGHTVPSAWDDYDQSQNGSGAAAGGSRTGGQQAFFRYQFNPGGSQFSTSNTFYAPFAPKKLIHYYTRWEANDPQVHYTIGDLVYSPPNTTNIEFKTTSRSPIPLLGSMSGYRRYEPWTTNISKIKPGSAPTATQADVSVKDPLLTASDVYDFNTNKVPNVGWLGRVHRGTPWQTLYLKAPIWGANTDPNQVINASNIWRTWSGHTNYVVMPWYTNGAIVRNTNGAFVTFTNWDSQFTFPTNDYAIVDLFTTAFNDNSSRGQLPVNQTNLAAWSALLSGVNVTPSIANSVTIEPAGIYTNNPFAAVGDFPPIVQILKGIMRTRTNTVPVKDPATGNYSLAAKFSNQSFQKLSDILNVPELTLNSPYLAGVATNLVSDEVLERIPQQILSLLRGGEQPRFVVYAFGQGLKPAPDSIYLGSGPYFQMCTNYQVTAETAVRAVVRVEGSLDPAKPDYPPRVVVENYNVLGPY